MGKGPESGEFQFQLGAIGSLRDCAIQCSTALFQFQLGAIGRLCICLMSLIMRRFQFQLGAIGSRVKQDQFNRGMDVSIPAWCDWESLDGWDYKQ